MTKQCKSCWNPFVLFSNVWKKLTGSISPKNKSSIANHDVAPKQIIQQDSLTKSEQRKFIDEGGDSQPLK